MGRCNCRLWGHIVDVEHTALAARMRLPGKFIGASSTQLTAAKKPENVLRLQDINARKPSSWFGPHPKNRLAAAAKAGARIAEYLCRPFDFLLFGLARGTEKGPGALNFLASEGMAGAAFHAAGYVLSGVAFIGGIFIGSIVGQLFRSDASRARIAAEVSNVSTLVGSVPALVAVNLGTCITGSVKLASAGVGALGLTLPHIFPNALVCHRGT